MRRTYPTDLSDAEWGCLEPQLPAPKATGRPRVYPPREILDAIFRERGDEIAHMKGWTWAVPSCSGEGLYAVDLRGESCQCPDRPPEGERCKHLYAATIARAKSGECAGCSRKVRRCELHPVPNDHLTFFGGDELCEGCALAHGAA